MTKLNTPLFIDARKKAKDLKRKSSDLKLSEAQEIVARELGFQSDFHLRQTEKKKLTKKERPRCSVSGCNHEADYKVYLYDYYDYADEEFMEGDFTCPYLCSEHKHENEKSAVGERRPRGMVRYPYTNKGMAQGYTKYKEL